MSFPRYPKYKDSGVEWLGEVPEHWDVRRLRQIGPLLKGCGGSREDVVETGVPCVRYGDLYTTHAYMIRQARTCVTEERAADYFPIRRGDVLFAASGEDLAEIGRSAVVLVDERACCGGDLVVLRRDVGVVPEFMGYACDCWVAKAQKASMGRGTTVKHIYPDELKRLLLALPPRPEQTAIASFLDHETSKIDGLIAEQQRLIELLQEKRQAAISHAVTKGLNPDAPMKDSAIEWLGEVPEHWEVRRISSLSTKITNGYVGPTRDILADSGVRYLQSLHIKNNRIAFNDPYFVSEEWSKAHAKSILQEGDVLIVQTGDIGQVAVVPKEYEGCNCHALIIVAPVREAIEGDWLGWVLNSEYGFHSLLAIQTGALHPHLNCGDVKDVWIPIPPLREQRDIVACVLERSGSMDSLITEAQAAITLLQERRSALISAAVTGQIDVRGLAGSEAA